jgi:hypothetical protein
VHLLHIRLASNQVKVVEHNGWLLYGISTAMEKNSRVETMRKRFLRPVPFDTIFVFRRSSATPQILGEAHWLLLLRDWRQFVI